ncbi:hypothetical protein Droror1_Dr00027971 [Drosera rotundifolia]
MEETSAPSALAAPSKKLEVYNEILRQHKESDNPEVLLPGFDNELWANFTHLPVRLICVFSPDGGFVDEDQTFPKTHLPADSSSPPLILPSSSPPSSPSPSPPILSVPPPRQTIISHPSLLSSSSSTVLLLSPPPPPTSPSHLSAAHRFSISPLRLPDHHQRISPLHLTQT